MRSTPASRINRSSCLTFGAVTGTDYFASTVGSGVGPMSYDKGDAACGIGAGGLAMGRAINGHRLVGVAKKTRRSV